VASVVPAGVAYDVIDPLPQLVRRFAFALVPPLSPDDDDPCHDGLSCQCPPGQPAPFYPDAGRAQNERARDAETKERVETRSGEHPDAGRAQNELYVNERSEDAGVMLFVNRPSAATMRE